MKRGVVVVALCCLCCFSLTAQLSEPKVAYKDEIATDFFKRSQGWIASDGGLTVLLADSSILWLMGDSHIDDYDSVTNTIPCLFQVRNAALHQPKNDWNWRNTKTLIGQGPGSKSLFKHTEDPNYWLWPGAGIQLDDTIFVYNGELVKKGSGNLGFAGTGNDLWAMMTFPDMEVVGYRELPDFDDINFGAGFIKDDTNGFVYAYGFKSVPQYASSDLYVARFRQNDPHLSWEFWNGSKWVKNVKMAAVIGTGGITPNVTRVKNKYLMLSTALSVACDQGREIYASTSDKPTGPFAGQKVLYSNDDTLDGHYPFFYTVVGHPQFINDRDELLITYCVNGYAPCIDPCTDAFRGRTDPNHYRPKGIRVPLKEIGAR